MPDPDKVESVDAQLNHLRSSIRDLGYQVDSYKAKTAAALGAGVFLLFLAIGAAYELAMGKGGMWLVLGVTRETVVSITSGLGVGATILLTVGFRRARLADTSIRTKLDLMEREYAELLERRDAGARRTS